MEHPRLNKIGAREKRLYKVIFSNFEDKSRAFEGGPYFF